MSYFNEENIIDSRNFMRETEIKTNKKGELVLGKKNQEILGYSKGKKMLISRVDEDSLAITMTDNPAGFDVIIKGVYVYVNLAQYLETINSNYKDNSISYRMIEQKETHEGNKIFILKKFGEVK